MRFSTERVTSAEQLALAHALRRDVFVEEQQVPLSLEVDDADYAVTTTHVLVRVADGAGPGDVVGTGRLLTGPAHAGVVHVGRVAVAASVRGTGAGAAVMAALEEIAVREHAHDGVVRVELSAQVHAIGFYERLGYAVDGPVYLDAGIEHRDAAKVIAAPPSGSLGASSGA